MNDQGSSVKGEDEEDNNDELFSMESKVKDGDNDVYAYLRNKL